MFTTKRTYFSMLKKDCFRSKTEPYWRSMNTWICTNHLPSISLPANATECWYITCPCKRPTFEERDAKFKVSLCGWEKCKRGFEGGHGRKKQGRKYCSHECRKDRARHTYNMKKKRAQSTENIVLHKLHQ